MNIRWDGVDKLEQKLMQKSAEDFELVASKNLRDIYTRGHRQPYKDGNIPESGGTPYDTGELRIALTYRPTQLEVGYLKDYAPHVEYGHVTKNGSYVPGQYYLKKNVDTQRPIYKEDLRNKLKE